MNVILSHVDNNKRSPVRREKPKKRQNNEHTGIRSKLCSEALPLLLLLTIYNVKIINDETNSSLFSM